MQSRRVPVRCCQGFTTAQEVLHVVILGAVAQVVTPWDVSGGTDGKIDYNKLLNEVRRSMLP